MKYSIEQQDPYLVLLLPRHLVSSTDDDSFWSALRAELCYMVCDKQGYTLIVDLRTIHETDTRALLQLRLVIDQISQLVCVQFVGPGPAVSALVARGEAPTLRPMEPRSPTDSDLTDSDLTDMSSRDSAPLVADGAALDPLVVALGGSEDPHTSDLDMSAEVHFLVHQSASTERSLASFNADNTSVAVFWHPHGESTAARAPAQQTTTGTAFPHGTWLELWSGEIGVIERQGGEANFLSLFERYGESTRTVMPRRVAVSRIPAALYRGVLENPFLGAANRSSITELKSAFASRESASGGHRTRRKELAL